MNTNWSSPKTNALAGINCLRKALASGENVRLVRTRNEECSYPIKVKQHDTDFRNYESYIGYGASIDSIMADTSMSDFEKHLSLNYVNCFGTPEAVKEYYTSGLLSPDNNKGMGVSHLVKAEDLIRFMVVTGDSRAAMYKRQYAAPEYSSVTHMYNFYKYKHGSLWLVKKFKRKLWVVELLGDDKPKPRTPVLVKVLNVMAYPLKWIPERNVLRMDEYKCVRFRWGSVINGFAIEFHVPKKFSFN